MLKYRTGIGQDGHRFLPEGSSKLCIIAGLQFDDVPGMDADSDGDVVFHALCSAITSLTHVQILGDLAPKLCHEQGITDSQVYLEEAFKTLGSQTIEHIAISIEGKRPRFRKRILEMRESVSRVLKLDVDQVGLTVTSGDNPSPFAQGEGLMCFCVVTTSINV